jgi:hypothetical protein
MHMKPRSRLLFPDQEQKSLLRPYGTMDEDVQLDVFDNNDTSNQEFTTTKLRRQLDNIKNLENIIESKISINKKRACFQGSLAVIWAVFCTVSSIFLLKDDNDQDKDGDIAILALFFGLVAIAPALGLVSRHLVVRRKHHSEGQLEISDQFTQLTPDQASQIASKLADIKENTGISITNIDENSNAKQAVSTLKALTEAKSNIQSALRLSNYLMSFLSKTNHFPTTKKVNAIHDIIVDYVMDPMKPEEECRKPNRLRFLLK